MRGRDGNEDEDGTGHETRDEGKTRSGNGDENIDKSGGGRELGNFRSGNRGGSEDIRGGGRKRVISNRIRKTGHPCETVVSCRGPNLRDGRRRR